MITILLEGDANQFGKVEAALRDASSFVFDDGITLSFSVNSDTACILIGNPNEHDIVLKAKLDE